MVNIFLEQRLIDKIARSELMAFHQRIKYFFVFLFMSMISSAQTLGLEKKSANSINLNYLFNMPQENYLKHGELFSGFDTLYVNQELEFNTSQQMLTKVHYSHGLKDKLEMYFESGNPYRIKTFNKMGCDGIDISYFDSLGKTRAIAYFQSGIVILPHVSLYETGEIKMIQFNTNNQKIKLTREFYKNGNIKYEHSIEEFQNPPPVCEKYYFENGLLMSISYYNQGRKTAREYYANGQVKFIGDYIKDGSFAVGKHIYYYSNGQIEKILLYKDSEYINEANIKVGTWKYYDINGKLIKKEKYNSKRK